MSDDPHDMDALLGTAERIVAKGVAKGAQQIEVYLSRDVSLELAIENNAIQSAGRSRSEGGSIRVVQDGRLGFAYFTSETQAEATIDRALALSRLAPAKGMQLPDPQPAADLASRWDDSLAALDVDQALALGKGLLDARLDIAPESQLAGAGVGIGFSVEALANHNGVAVADRTTGIDAGINVVLEDGESALNSWDSVSRHTGTIDPVPLVSQVVEDLRSLRGPTDAKGGHADIVFRPDAVSELITGIVVSAVDGDDAMRGKTVWSERLGEQVAAKGFSLRDDPTVAGATGVGRFDGDGLPVRPLPIIEAGVLKTFLFDTRDGHEHGMPSTHSAVRGAFKSPPSVGTQHLVIDGDTPDERLIGDVDHGYLIDSVLGAHTANATTGDFSVTAPNVWRIEKGEVAGPVSEIAIGGNLPELLGRIDGIGTHAKQMDGARLPMLRFRDVQVSA